VKITKRGNLIKRILLELTWPRALCLL